MGRNLEGPFIESTLRGAVYALGERRTQLQAAILFALNLTYFVLFSWKPELIEVILKKLRIWYLTSEKNSHTISVVIEMGKA